MLVHDEGARLEFKETFSYNSHTNSKDEKLQKASIRAIASLLNSDGGTLLIGVSDPKKIIVGIERDLTLWGRSRDKFELALRDQLTSQFGAAVVSELVDCSFQSIDDVVVFEVRVAPSDVPCWYAEDGRDVLFVRSGNQTQEIRARDLPQYFAKRFPKMA